MLADRVLDAHPLRQRIEELIDEYRAALDASVEGMTEDEARMQLVPSATTLLGVLKHVTFVEGVWFDQAVTGRSSTEIGIADTVDDSFALTDEDTIASCGTPIDAAARHHENGWPSSSSTPR